MGPWGTPVATSLLFAAVVMALVRRFAPGGPLVALFLALWLVFAAVARAKLASKTTSTSLDAISFVRVWSAKMNPIVLKKAQGHAATFSSRLVLRPTITPVPSES